jgi:hypothetical protein
MKNKLKIVETEDYILALSDEEIKEGDYQLVPMLSEVEKATKENIHLSYMCYKIIAYQPKNNAPELDLPLLPQLIVEDDVEKLACNIYNLAYEEYLHIRENVSQTRDCIEAEYEYLGLEIPNKYFDILSFIAGYNYKAATKIYSEEDLRNIAKELASECLCIDGEISSPAQAFKWIEKKNTIPQNPYT